MKEGSGYAAIWLGFLLTFASAWVGLVIIPMVHLGSLEQPDIELSPDQELIDYGRQVYVENGCMYCHSQQVRPEYAGSDKKYGWGQRRTLPTDYLNDKVALMGTMRTGPDLSDIGVRQPSDNWHLTHLYDPQITSAGSTMPPFAFLFEKQKMEGKPSPDALKLGGKWAPPEGYEVVPTREALALVAYLKSLKKTQTPVPENVNF